MWINAPENTSPTEVMQKKNTEINNINESISWATKLDNDIQNNLLLLTKKIQEMEKNIKWPKDVFDEKISGKMWSLQEEINKIAQENNKEYSYVLSLYNIVKQYGDKVDLNNLNTVWTSSFVTSKWEIFEEDYSNSNKILSTLKLNKPILLSSNSYIKDEDIQSWNILENRKNFHSIISTIPMNISSDDLNNNFTAKEISKDIDISKITDSKEINRYILDEFSQMTWEVEANVDSTSEKYLKETNTKFQSNYLTDLSTYTNTIVSNFQTIENKDKNKITIKAILYLPKKNNG